jgi:hypothetical protein
LRDHRKPAGLTIVDELAAQGVVRTPGQRDISHMAIVRWFLMTKVLPPLGSSVSRICPSSAAASRTRFVVRSIGNEIHGSLAMTII